MAKVTQGLKQLAKRDILPAGAYTFRIERVAVTKNEQGEGAFLTVIKAEEEELVGRKSYLYLYNYETEKGYGLSQLLASLQLEEVPGGDHGESNTQNLVGCEFDANVTIGKDKKTGEDRANVSPEYDSEWLEEVRNRPDDEPKGRKTKKKTSRSR